MKSGKAARTSNHNLKTLKSRWIRDDSARQAAAFIEGPADHEAKRILLEAGALQLVDDNDQCVEASIYSLSKGVHDGIGPILDFIDTHVSDAIRVQLSDAVSAASSERALTAYLLGVAVGRRLGPQRFTA